MADHNGAAANTSENRSLLPSQPQSYCTAALKVTVITISQIILNGFCAMNDKKVWPILFNLRPKLTPQYNISEAMEQSFCREEMDHSYL